MLRRDSADPMEAVSSVRVSSTYARSAEIVLERSEFVDENMTIGDLIRSAKKLEDLDVELVEIRLELPNSYL